MTDWQEVKLGEICHQITDGVHNTVKDCVNGEYYLLSCKNLKDGQIVIGTKERKIDEITLQNLRKRTRTSKGDVLLSSVGTIGETAIIRDDFPNYEFQRSVAIFKPNKDYITPEFLFYSLNNNKELLQHSAEGAVQQCLFITPLKEFTILLPPLEIQKKIAAVLGALDDKIELNNKINNNLEQQAQALFKSWFIDFEPFGGIMPTDWKVGKIDDLAQKIICGKTPSTRETSYYGKDVPFITIPDMHNNTYIVNTERYLSISGADSQKGKMLPKNSVCVSCIGTAGLVSLTAENSQTNQQINSIIAKKNISPYFIYLLMKSLFEKIQTLGAGGSTICNLNKTQFSNIEVILPNVDILEDFDKITCNIFEEILHNQQENTHLAQLRDTLLPKLMSGEIDVSNVDISNKNLPFCKE